MRPSTSAKQTGTTSGCPAASAVARRATRAVESISTAHVGASSTLLDELGELVEQREDLVARLRRQPEHRARDAGLAIAVEHRLVGRGAEDVHRDRLHVAT